MKISEPPVVVEQDFNCTIDRLWSALTDPQEMVQWFFENIPDFRPLVGFHTEFAVHVGEKTFTHQWTVVEAIPKAKISYRWKYQEYPGDSFVHFTIKQLETGCSVTLETQVIEDFSDEVEEFRRASCVQGWQYFLQQRLKNYLQK